MMPARPARAAAVTLAAATAATSALAAAPSPALAAAADPLRVSVRTQHQHEVVRAPELRVRVTAARPGTVRLALSTEVGMGRVSVARAVTVRFARAGEKTVTVKLTEAGAARLLACGVHRVRAAATLRSGERAVVRRGYRSLRGTPELCRAPAPPPVP